MSVNDFGATTTSVKSLSQISTKDLAGDERWALAQRIASSQGFMKAAQLRELLLYLCRQAITDPSMEMTEQEIGSRVLGRRPDYDTQADNIVRVQIRHLRQKLEEYFAAEGQNEPLIIKIPKGGRDPHFEPRAVAATGPAEGPAGLKLRAKWGRVVLTGVAVAAVAFALGRVSADWSGMAPARRADLSKDPLWTRLFTPNDQTTIVISDSNLAFVQDMLHANFTMDDLGKGSMRRMIDAMPDEKLRACLQELTVRQYTSMADATVSSRLASIGDAMGSKVSVRYSRHMGIRDFNSGNFVVVGSRRGIPWVNLFEPSLNFRLQPLGPSRQFGIVNQAPQKGEATEYMTVRSADGRYETYAVLAMLPNLKQTGDVLLLQGIMMEGTEAAGEFAMSKAFSKLVSDKFGATPAGQLPYFEVLLKIQAVSGAPNKVQVVAWRRPSAS